jgi:hypothetical protein
MVIKHRLKISENKVRRKISRREKEGKKQKNEGDCEMNSFVSCTKY